MRGHSCNSAILNCEWNKLPLFVRKSATVNDFKIRLKTNLLNNALRNKNCVCSFFFWNHYEPGFQNVSICAQHANGQISKLALHGQKTILNFGLKLVLNFVKC